MAEIVPMPKLGFDMAEGTLVRRVKQVGDAVAKGDIIAEVETDKATIEVEAYLGGVIKGWVIDEGKSAPVGSPMVVIGGADEAVDVAALTGVQAASPAPAAPSAPAPVANGVPSPEATAGPTAVATPAAATTETGRVLASPVARRLASEAGLALGQIQGSGPGGRVIKRDVEAALAAGSVAAGSVAAGSVAAGTIAAGTRPGTAAPTLPTPKAPAAVAPVAVQAEDEVVPLTKLRGIIARRMHESTSTVPAIYLTIEVDMAAALALRKQINGLVDDAHKVSVNDLVLKAAALALRQFPNLNSSFGGDKIVRHGHVNVGFAVAMASGLLTVVTRDTDAKSLTQIAAETKPMIVRARDGKVQPADIEGSTFTVSNLGMYDIEHFTAIINLPEAAILAVGATKDVPVVKDGQIVIGTRMKMTCAADHRVTDGAEVAQFLVALRKNLEEPLRLMV